jgi:Kef-type K+ transport system membrane component KefB
MDESKTEIKQKKLLFDKDSQRWIIITALCVCLAAASQINLYGVAAVVFAFLVGLGIMEHGIYTKEIQIIEKVKP